MKAQTNIKHDAPNWDSFKVLLIHTIIAPHHSRSNIQMVKGHLPSSGLEQASALLGAVDVASIANCNLSEETKELLHLHFCLGHVNFKTLSGMVRHRNIQVQSPKLAGNVCPCPKCAACEFGKAVRQGSKATTTWHDPDRDMDPKKSILHAGQHIASDHCHVNSLCLVIFAPPEVEHLLTTCFC